MTDILDRAEAMLAELGTLGLSAEAYEARRRELAAFYTNLALDLAGPKPEMPFVVSRSFGEGRYLPVAAAQGAA